jgi:hypothetical protein
MSHRPNADLELGNLPAQRSGAHSPGASAMLSRCWDAPLILDVVGTDVSSEEQLTERQRSYRGAKPSTLVCKGLQGLSLHVYSRHLSDVTSSTGAETTDVGKLRDQTQRKGR